MLLSLLLRGERSPTGLVMASGHACVVRYKVVSGGITRMSEVCGDEATALWRP